LRDDNARLNRDTAELAKLRGDNARLLDSARELAQMKSSSGDLALDGTARLWATRVKSLRQRLQEKPDEQIPELNLLTDTDWLEAMKSVDSLQTDADFRRATGNLRNRAKEKLGKLAREAFKKYAEANDGMLPGDFAQLKPYFDTPAEDGIFQRYELRQSGKLN